MVRVTPLENLCGCSLTRWVGESDSTLYVRALLPDGLVRVTPLEDCALSPDGMVRVTPLDNLCGYYVTR